MPSEDWVNNRVVKDGDVPPGGHLIRAARQACFLKQIDVGMVMGRTQKWVSHIERDQRILTEDSKAILVEQLLKSAKTSKAHQKVIELSTKYVTRPNIPFVSRTNKWSHNLIRIRTLLNITQTEIATHFGVSSRSLKYWESQEYIPSHRVIEVCDKLEGLSKGDVLILSMIGQLRSELPVIVKKGRPFRKKYAKKPRKLKVIDGGDSIES